MGERDDFSIEVKRALAARVGLLCSNFECRAPTAGPQSDPAKAVNIGVAAHITAAAPGGPRYDTELSAEARAAATNGLWVCQNCAKRIDNDPSRYTAELLRAWKVVAESAADAAIGKPALAPQSVSIAPTLKEKTIAAIVSNAPNVSVATRTFMVDLAERLGTLSAKLYGQQPPTFQDFSAHITEANPIVRDFGDVASAAAEFNPDVVPTLAKGFEPIIELYESRAVGTTWNASFDVAKFIGHEMFLTMVSAMIRLERWAALNKSLAQTLFALRSGEKRPLNYRSILSDIVLVSAFEPPPGQRWASPHGAMLNARYGVGDMPISFRDLVDADYLVYLVSAFAGRDFYVWLPVTAPHLKDAPEWLVRCQSLDHLMAMLPLFGVKDADEFREKFAKLRLPRFSNSFMIDFRLMRPDKIGTHP